MLRFSLPLLLAVLPLLHTRLARSEPAAASVLSASPRELRLWFEGGIEPEFTRVTLRASSGARLALGAPREGGEPGLIVVPVPLALAPDEYRVGWYTVGRDGHPVQGEYVFAVGQGAGAAPRATVADDSTAWGAGAAGRTVVGGRIVDPLNPELAPTESPAQYAAGMRPVRWIELVALVAALGAVAMLLLVLRTAPGSPAHERFLVAATRGVRTVAVAASIVYLLAAIARLIFETNAMHAATGPVSAEALGRTLATGWGRAWMIATTAMAALLVSLLLRHRADRSVDLHRPSRGSDLALAVAALVAAIGPALTGHAAGSVAMMPLSVFSDWIHVVGASAWIGGVMALAVAGTPAALAQPQGERVPALAWLVSAFHALAVPAITLVAASGLLSAWLRLGSWQALTRTNYGDLVLFKVYVVAFAALLGAYHWKRVHPRLVAAVAGDDRAARRMHWTLYVELIAGVAVLALTAALVTTPPPQ